MNVAPALRFLPAGQDAVLIELDDTEQALGLAGWLRARVERGEGECREIVPGAQTVLLVAPDPAVLQACARWRPSPLEPTGEVEIEVVYDGPDLSEVAALWGIGPDEVGPLHSSWTHTAAFTGFAPGFAYLTGLPPTHAVPRRSSPRSRVPAGSVAVASTYTGIYPTASPGGWLLIGRTAQPLFDLAADPPALLTPGVRVRFRT